MSQPCILHAEGKELDYFQSLHQMCSLPLGFFLFFLLGAQLDAETIAVQHKAALENCLLTQTTPVKSGQQHCWRPTSMVTPIVSFSILKGTVRWSQQTCKEEMIHYVEDERRWNSGHCEWGLFLLFVWSPSFKNTGQTPGFQWESGFRR